MRGDRPREQQVGDGGRIRPDGGHDLEPGGLQGGGVVGVLHQHATGDGAESPGGGCSGGSGDHTYVALAGEHRNGVLVHRRGG